MGNALLFGLPQSQIDRLQRIQNSAARIVTLSRKACHITPVLRELHWLPVKFRIIYKMLLFVYKSIHGLAPAYIDDLLQPYNPTRSLRSSSMNLFREPRSSHSWGIVLFHVLHLVFGTNYRHGYSHPLPSHSLRSI